MSILLPNPFHNVKLPRACGGFTTTATLPTPRPTSARGTPRLGPSATPESAIFVDTRRPKTAGATSGGRATGDLAQATSRRGSAVSAYRENWDDPTAAAAELNAKRPSPPKSTRGESSTLHKPLRVATARVLKPGLGHLTSTTHPGISSETVTKAAAIRRQQSELTSNRGSADANPEHAVRRPRSAQVPRLTEEQRRRARLIMRDEDSAAAKFVASAQSFDPQAVVARARMHERIALDQQVAAARTDVMWAKLRRDHTRAQIDELNDKVRELEQQRAAIWGTAVTSAPPPPPADASVPEVSHHHGVSFYATEVPDHVEAVNGGGGGDGGKQSSAAEDDV